MGRKILSGAIAILYLVTAGPDPRGGLFLGTGAAEAQPADRGSGGRGRSESAPGRSGEAPGNSGAAPGRSGGAPGNSGNAPGRSGEAPGNSGNAPGRSGEAPGNSGAAPGRSGGAPGNSGNAPGRSGEAPGNSGNAPGRSGEAPGNSGNAPGNSGNAPGRSGAPGNSGNAPGRSGEAPGNSGNAPGRSGEAPGNSGNAPGRSGGAPANSAPGRSGAGGSAGGNAPAQAQGTAPRTAPSAGAEPPEPVQAAAAPQIRPVFRRQGSDDASTRQNEISVVGLDAAARSALTAAGFSTITSRRSSVLGNRDVSRLRIPSNLTPQEAAAAVRQSFDVVADLTHLYRPAAQPTSVRYAHELVGVEPAARCSVNLRIGLVDTGTSRHETLRRARLVQRSFVDRRDGGNTLHGTAVASLLVGDLPGLEPLLPGARLYSANVFSGHQGVLAADVTAIIEALDWMAANRTRVVNLSLMGPANELLEQAVLGAARKGLILVAAGGNDGPSAPPAYPAAYPAVIAVAAVDERGRAYSGNNRGSYVEISAPGVDIWAAHGRGGEAFWTGTSFAVPFVTAALAREVAAGRVRHIDDARRFLGASARDLGPRGRDSIYGHGLLRARNCR